MSSVPSQCLSWEWHLECMELTRQAGYHAGWKDGNETALIAASDAITSLGTGWTAADDREPYWLITKADARAAIEALGGER